MPGVTRWTPGRVILLLLLIGFLGYTFNILAAFTSLPRLLVSVTYNNTQQYLPPEARTINSIALFFTALLTAPLFVAITIAAGLVKDVLERK